MLDGKRFGRLVASSAYDADGRRVRWWCRCDCGVEKWVDASKLKSGSTVSCGCWRREKIAKALTKHGHARASFHTAEYCAWLNAHYRCENPEHKNFKNYGARGIRVCDRWSGSGGFQNFLSDMGCRPSADHSLDRVDCDGHYEPINCRWATRKQQTRNKRNVILLPFNGRMMTIPEIAREMGLNSKSLWKRVRRKALTSIVMEAVNEERRHKMAIS